MHVTCPVYEDTVIAVVLWAEDEQAAEKCLFTLAVRYLPPEDYRDRDGDLTQTTNCMGGETDWFILPYDFGVASAKRLIEQKVGGLTGFNGDGFQKMVRWLVEMQEMPDAMCY